MFFADIDEIINYENMSLKELTKIKGEGFYEKLERKTIASVLDFRNAVISAPLTAVVGEENLRAIKKKTFVIFIKISNDRYVSKKQRERTASGEKLKLGQDTFDERQRIFENAADLTIDAKKDVKRTVDETIKQIRKYFGVDKI